MKINRMFFPFEIIESQNFNCSIIAKRFFGLTLCAGPMNLSLSVCTYFHFLLQPFSQNWHIKFFWHSGWRWGIITGSAEFFWKFLLAWKWTKKGQNGAICPFFRYYILRISSLLLFLRFCRKVTQNW